MAKGRGLNAKVLTAITAACSISFLLNARNTFKLFRHDDDTCLECSLQDQHHPPRDIQETIDDQRHERHECHTLTPVTIQRKPRILHCGGYALNRNFRPVLQSVLPEYDWVHLLPRDPKISNISVLDWNATKFFDYAESHPLDIFVTNWKMDDCKRDTKVVRWLHLYFKGKILFLNPEDGLNMDPPLDRPQFYELGPGNPDKRNRFQFTFLQAAFWAQLSNADKKMFTGERPRPISDGRNLLIYAHSNCVDIREESFRSIARLKLGVVHYGGRCNGGIKNESQARRYSNDVSLKNWENNRVTFQSFMFCLTMEHGALHVGDPPPGYITEKILVGFWAGCIPIYYGPPEIMAIFNENAFIYYDPKNSTPALARIRDIATNNDSLAAIYQEPILAPGAAEKFFSFDATIGGGRLRNRIRQFLNLAQIY